MADAVEPRKPGSGTVVPDAARVAELQRWLIEVGHFAPDAAKLLDALCVELGVLGVPLARATIHVRTLHPEFRGISRIWRAGTVTEIRTPRHGIEAANDYERSPVQYVYEGGGWLDRRLDESTDRRFPILASLRAQGITHYVMAPLRFSSGTVNAMSWATEAPEGFSAADLAMLHAFVPTFAPILEAKVARRVAGELLATYVGRDPGARIIAGNIERGDVNELKAAMLLADLRGFSPLTDELPAKTVVELLNAFFDLIVPAIVERGGEVLKYIGDAVIAIFPVAGDAPAACRAALGAARAALAAREAAPPEIRREIVFDIALHLGDMAYGNIGSGNRLDFTAIGRDVNILSRLELLCKAVERPLLMTDVFAAEIGEPTVEIGHFELRGFRRHQPVFGIAEASSV